jgi:hypothetical protein
MKTLSGLVLASALLAIAGIASAGDEVEVIVVTAKKAVATMLDDMTDEIFAEAADAIRLEQRSIAAPEVQIEIPALAPEHG